MELSGKSTQFLLVAARLDRLLVTGNGAPFIGYRRP
jgi:hypothetical protein